MYCVRTAHHLQQVMNFDFFNRRTINVFMYVCVRVTYAHMFRIAIYSSNSLVYYNFTSRRSNY